MPENGTVILQSINMIRIFRTQFSIDQCRFVIIVQMIVAIGQMRQDPRGVQMFQCDRLEEFNGLSTLELREVLKTLTEQLEHVDDVLDDFYRGERSKSSLKQERSVHNEPGVRRWEFDWLFRWRSRLLMISVSTPQFKLVLLERTWDLVVILFGDSPGPVGVLIVISVQAGREVVFVRRVLRFVGARIDLFSWVKRIREKILRWEEACAIALLLYHWNWEFAIDYPVYYLEF